jgi:hypothetical protein
MTEAKQSDHFRNLSVMASSLTAVLAIFPALWMSHGHAVMGMVCIGMQLVLLTLSVHFFMKYRRLEATERNAAESL